MRLLVLQSVCHPIFINLSQKGRLHFVGAQAKSHSPKSFHSLTITEDCGLMISQVLGVTISVVFRIILSSRASSSLSLQLEGMSSLAASCARR
jgi:hypothetical protein